MIDLNTDTDIAAAAARLSASRRRFNEDEFNAGKDVGVTWAFSGAEWAELQTVITFADSGEVITPEDLARAFAEDLDDGLEVLSGITDGNAYPSAPWIEGFVAGAVEAYRAVEKHL